jgi:superoxide reductase
VKIIKLKGSKKMTEEGQIYLCEICGNKVEILESGAGTLVCCGQNMTLME